MQYNDEKKEENALVAINYHELYIEIMSKRNPEDITIGACLSELAELYQFTDNDDRALVAYEMKKTMK